MSEITTLTTPQTFGQLVRKRRVEKEISPERLAADVGMSLSTLGRIERGEGDVRLTQVIKLSRRLDLDLADVMEELGNA